MSSTNPASLTASSLFSIKDHVVLVTGGGSGLGSYIATAYAANGAKVYITGRRLESLKAVVANWESNKTAGGGQITAIQGDISSKEGIAKLVADFTALEPNGLDTLFNNAGILPKQSVPKDFENPDKYQKSLFESSWEDWQNTYQVNTTAVFFTSAAFVPLLRKAPHGDPNIVNVTSIAGHHISPHGHPAYQASKAATSYLTENLAARFLPFKIRVNGIAPGLYRSEMTEPNREAIRETHKVHFQALPAGRAGDAEDISGPALLLGSKAGAYINGQVLKTDGGRLLVLSGNP